MECGNPVLILKTFVVDLGYRTILNSQSSLSETTFALFALQGYTEQKGIKALCMSWPSKGTTTMNSSALSCSGPLAPSWKWRRRSSTWPTRWSTSSCPWRGGWTSSGTSCRTSGLFVLRGALLISCHRPPFPGRVQSLLLFPSTQFSSYKVCRSCLPFPKAIRKSLLKCAFLRGDV